MKRFNVQFVLPFLIITVLLINQGLVVCICQAGHIKVQPVVHSSCHCEHEHSGDSHSSHLSGIKHPVDGGLFAIDQGKCRCDICVDVPLDNSEMLPGSDLNLSAYFAFLSDSVAFSEIIDMFPTPITRDSSELRFHFPLSTVIMRN